MENYYFLLKSFIILSIFCIILLLGVRINEQFDNLFPTLIRVNVDTNNRKDRLILKWVKSNEDISRYFIIYLKNNDGPFIITLPNLDIPNNTNKYEFLDVQMNVDQNLLLLLTTAKKLLSTVDNHKSKVNSHHRPS